MLLLAPRLRYARRERALLHGQLRGSLQIEEDSSDGNGTLEAQRQGSRVRRRDFMKTTVVHLYSNQGYDVCGSSSSTSHTDTQGIRTQFLDALFEKYISTSALFNQL